MRLGIATDHGGWSLKEELITRLRADWKQPTPLDTYQRANDPGDKTTA